MVCVSRPGKPCAMILSPTWYLFSSWSTNVKPYVGILITNFSFGTPVEKLKSNMETYNEISTMIRISIDSISYDGKVADSFLDICWSKQSKTVPWLNFSEIRNRLFIEWKKEEIINVWMQSENVEKWNLICWVGRSLKWYG